MTELCKSVPQSTAMPSDGEPAPKRRNLGRNARHRRKKALEIEAVAAGKSESKPPTILPNDRDYVWPAVQQLCELSETDKKDLLAQLGYLPGNALSVAARLNDAFPEHFPNDSAPLVLQLYPLVLRDETDSTKARRKRKQQPTSNDKTPLMEPFPTMFWVTHPRIRALISKLELNQRGIQFEKRLKEDSHVLEQMEQAHKAYGQQRSSLITQADQKWIEERKWEPAFAPTRGVAGIRNYASVKCLHAHAAHFWSGCQDNVIGAWVNTELSSRLQDTNELAGNNIKKTL